MGFFLHYCILFEYNIFKSYKIYIGEKNVIPWEEIDRAKIPGKKGEVILLKRDSEFSIRTAGTELMNSRVHGSEDALAELTCRRIKQKSGLRILIGGLGMGFTLAAALEQSKPNTRIIVSELIPAVVKWNREHLGHLAGLPLSDPRVSVKEEDVAKIIRTEKSAWDAVILDVDNGPEGLTRKANDRLYTRSGLKTSFFVEYKLIDAAYDDRTQTDNTSQFFYGGVKWDTTEKLALLLKLGYQKKKFVHVDLGQGDFEGFVYDLQFTYRYSEKTSFKLDTYRTNEETDNFLASDQTVLGVGFTYNQKFSEKWSGNLVLAYEDADYSNFHLAIEEDRDDEIFSIRPALEYLFREWLMFELAYEYESRESTVDFFNYDTNTVMFSINLAL